jgi:glycosyltransferase involved in cell wall biosynthesis
MQDLPKVSVCILTFNRPRQLPVCLFSLSKQTYKGPLELVIVNDGDDVLPSPTLEQLMDGFVARYGPGSVKFIQNATRQGMAKGRNIAIRAATGDLLIKMDDDHYSYGDMIERLVDAHQTVQRHFELGRCARPPGCIGTLFPYPQHMRELVVKPSPQRLGRVEVKPREGGYEFTVDRSHELGQLDLYDRPDALIPADVLRGIYLHDRDQAFDESLTHVSHTEETRHSWAVHCSGKQNYVAFGAVCWHLHADEGGVRHWDFEEMVEQKQQDMYSLYDYLADTWNRRKEDTPCAS